MRLFWIVPFGLAVALAAWLVQNDFSRDALPAWYVAINVIAFFTYGYDKRVAGWGYTRVPELVLWALAAAGGWPLAALGMWLFHHKTGRRTAGFRQAFRAAIVLNLVLLVVVLSR